MNIHFRFLIVAVAVFASVVVLTPMAVSAAKVEAKYYAADRCYKDLKNNPAHQKYRDRWFQCIEKYLSVQKQAPRGKWAAVGLYRAGQLYAELYRHSIYRKDKQKALAIFDRVIREYPKSAYRSKAIAAKKALLKKGRQNNKRKTTKKSKAPNKKITTKKSKTLKKKTAKRTAARSPYNRAQAHYKRLQENPRLKQYRDQWMKSIDDYRRAFTVDPEGPLAAAALYGMARCYNELHHFSRREADQQAAIANYRKLIDKFPDSAYAGKAKTAMPEELAYAKGTVVDGDDVAQVIQDATIDRAASATNNDRSAATSGQPSNVNGLRFWSNPRYTRVVIDADKDTIFTYRELREDPALGKPQRIYIDIHKSRLGKNLQKVVPINDNLLSDARAGQYSKDTVRVVVDIKSSKTFKIFSLKNPFRVVLDVWGVDKEEIARTQDKKDPKGKKLRPSAIVKQLALGVRRVVIDPGHGGKDYGAPGYMKGVHEKKVVLQLAKTLRKMIRDQVKCEVILTRSSDKYLSLEERTAIANTKNADLFVSIHTNASKNRKAYGIETYILNLATDDEAIRVAAMENATSTKNISDLDSILQDLMNNAKVSESTRLGSYVQQSMSRRLKKKYKNIRDKGVKQAPFYVLLGAEMPSILIETSFISNPRECKRLINKAYQRQICQGIVDGIKRYIRETNPTAFRPANGFKGSS